MKKVLFLDRDGVINIDHGYLYKAQDFEFIDGVFEACLAFQNAGYEIVVITNQSGIARGYYSEQDFQTLTTWMTEQFNRAGISILDVFYCPHHPEKGHAPYVTHCDCRKPEPGMLLKAIEKHNIDPKSSIMVGDKSSDMLAATKAKIGEKYLVQSGQAFSNEAAQHADAVYPDLKALSQSRLS